MSDTFRIERSTVIAAAPKAVYAAIADFHRWVDWSPWERLDPNLGRTYSGKASGVGAVYDWTGAKAGTGRMEILEAKSGAKVRIQLDFIKPMKANNFAEFTLAPEGEGTRVHWAMYGPKTLMSKIMGLFLNSDKMVGAQFEEGLANLKRISETKA